jgi:hypothetical protein
MYKFIIHVRQHKLKGQFAVPCLSFSFYLTPSLLSLAFPLTSLLFSCHPSSFFNVACVLLAAGVDINSRDNGPALCLCANVQICKAILAIGADVKLAFKRAGPNNEVIIYTALSQQIELGHVENVKLLLSAGADANRSDCGPAHAHSSLRTPLAIACSSKSQRDGSAMVKALLQSKADPHLPCGDGGETVAALAAKTPCPYLDALARLVRDHVANLAFVAKKDKEGESGRRGSLRAIAAVKAAQGTSALQLPAFRPRVHEDATAAGAGYRSASPGHRRGSNSVASPPASAAASPSPAQEASPASGRRRSSVSPLEFASVAKITLSEQMKATRDSWDAAKHKAEQAAAREQEAVNQLRSVACSARMWCMWCM